MTKLVRIALFTGFVFLMTALCYSSAMVPVSTATYLPTQTTQPIENYTYLLPNYVVNYIIVGMPPPDSHSVNPYAYNIVVYGPPPLPIQISFYEQTKENATQKMTTVMLTNALSTSIGCTSYPTQIGMMFIETKTGVNGTIANDTTWTKANSPYTLSAPVVIPSGVTLTIEPGTTVNFVGGYIHVSGTLTARGTPSENIVFNQGEIRCAKQSTSWNEQTNVGSIIENAVFNSTTLLIFGSPKIISNIMRGHWSGSAVYVRDGSPVILNNIINYPNTDFPGVAVYGGSPLIKDNQIGGITIWGGSPAISSNNIRKAGYNPAISINGGTPIIFNNIINPGTYEEFGGSVWWYEHPLDQISPPYTITHKVKGIVGGSVKAIISNNIITNCTTAIDIGGNVVIQNNSIRNSDVGINFYRLSSATVNYNNFENNSQYNIILNNTSAEINAAYNWWGTLNSDDINKSIHDLTAGKVDYSPFLSEQNPQAIPNPNAPMPSNSSPSPSENPTPDQNGNPTTPQTNFYGIAIAVFVVMLGIALLTIGVVFIRKKNRQTNNYAAENHYAYSPQTQQPYNV